MKTIKTFALSCLLGAVTVVAADLYVQRATLWGPDGTAQGKLVIRGDQMTFVDDNDPDMSFIIPKTDVRTARWEGGRLSIEVANPYTSRVGRDRREVVFMMPDQSSAGSVITWVGVPVAGFSGDADRAATPRSTMNITDIHFDVHNGDQKGRLMLQDNELVFESLTDAKHSARWRYSDIRELSKNDHELKIQPYKGDKYEFQFKNKAMLETAHNLLSDKIVAARQGK